MKIKKTHDYPIGYRQGYIEVIGYSDDKKIERGHFLKMYKCKCHYCGNVFITNEELIHGSKSKKGIRSCSKCKQSTQDTLIDLKEASSNNKLGLRNIAKCRNHYVVYKTYKGVTVRLWVEDLNQAIILRDDLIEEFKQFKNMYERKKIEGASNEELELFSKNCESIIKHRFQIQGY